MNCYIEEVQQYQDYLDEMANEIGDGADLKQIDCMRELMSDAVMKQI